MFFRRRRFAPAVLLASLFTCLNAAAAEPSSPSVQLLRNRPAAERPQLMLLGVAHFANYGRDVVNAQVPDVLEPQRQKEIDDAVSALLKFKPTKVVVEWESDEQARFDQRYNAYRAGTYQLSRNETDQLAMRLAARLGHERVYAVDWNKMPPGQVDDFDYVQWAQKNGQQARLDAMRDKSRAIGESKFMRDAPVAAWIVRYNQPEQLEKAHRAYFDYAMLGEPGANWVGNWYARNLKIFANLVRLADKREDRLLVIYGSGHVFPLQEFAQQSGAFQVVSPLQYLPASGNVPARD